MEYLRALKLAAETMESEVEAAIAILLEARELPRSAALKDLVRPEESPIPELSLPAVDLRCYDALLEQPFLEEVAP
jgi:hypothetical protein